ncbi:hypothetical protein J4E90_011027, partial [Alternaria incomplexa]|uniref:uncharacterized protein n=1 Tax=Alternaria incomplexa TaxID=1187928 RepID=UPI00221E8130
AFGVQQFLGDVEAPNESENLLRDIEKKIANLHRRIVEVEKGTPLASGSGSAFQVPAPPVLPGVRVADAFDAVGTAVSNDAKGPRKRRGKNERERARRREQERHRNEKMKELGVLLKQYKEQAEVVKGEAEKTAEMRKRREEVLAKKRALLQQLNAHEEEERRASLVKRTGMAKREGGLAEGFELDEVLDDAMKKVKRQPMHPPREEREYKEREVKDVDVPRAKRLVRPAGTGAEQTQTTASKPSNKPSVEELVHAAANDFTSSVANAGDPFPLASVQQKPSTKASKPIKKDTPRSPLSPPSSKDDLRLNIPPSGIVPIDADLILSLDSPVPALQSQVLALRNRLKSSYPRIDNLPYDVWTSSNKRTLQTWLKILISRWNARFDDVDGTGQVDKSVVDERVKEVLDSMVA